MSPWLWLLVPVVVTTVAWCVVTWRQRPRGPGEPLDTVTKHLEFRRALSDGSPPPQPRQGVVLRTGGDAKPVSGG